MSEDDIRTLIGAIYQTVSAIVHQNEHPTSDGDAHDTALLDILSDPDALPLDDALTRLDQIAQYYWAKGEPNVCAPAALASARGEGTPQERAEQPHTGD